MPIQTQTVPAFMGGMVTDVVPWGLDDSQCRFAQDVLFDKPNLARRRGIVKEATTVGGTVFSDASDSGYYGVGIVGVRAPDSNDTWRIATLFGKIDTDSAKLKVYANSYTSTTNVSLTGEYDPPRGTPIQSAPVPGAGIVIGTSQGYGGNRQQQLFQWAGASKADDNTGTLTVVAAAPPFSPSPAPPTSSRELRLRPDRPVRRLWRPDVHRRCGLLLRHHGHLRGRIPRTSPPRAHACARSARSTGTSLRA